MEYIFAMLMLIMFNGLPILYLGLMIYFLLSKDEKLKKIGKIMLGIIITIIILFLILFVTCVGFIFFMSSGI